MDNVKENNDSPSVSIIVPTYNAASTIEQCLGAIFKQDYPAFEVVVVDDASTDSTISKLSSFQLTLIQNERNRGGAFSRNKGVQAAKFEYILFVDSDVVIPPNAVSSVMKDFKTFPKMLAIGAIYSDRSEHLNYVSDFKNLDLAYRCLLCCENVRYLGSFFMAIRKDTFNEANGFSESFTGTSVEDIEFGYRVSNAEKRMFIDKQILVDHWKRYTLYSMLKTDFFRVVNMMKIIKQSKGKYKAGEEASFSYFLNMGFPLLFTLAIALGILLSAWWGLGLVLLVFIINNLGFMSFLQKRRGLFFCLKSVFVLLVEYFVVDTALFCSLFYRRS